MTYPELPDGQASDAIPLTVILRDELDAFSRAVHEALRPTAGPYAIFHHSGHARERCIDLELVLKRMRANRWDLRLADEEWDRAYPVDWPSGVPLPEAVQKISRQKQELTQCLKLDFETLYLFGNVLLDQLTFMFAYAVGDQNPEQITFSALVKGLGKETYTGGLKHLWSEERSRMIWLHAQVTLHRNRFITHADRPWQRSMIYSRMFDDFELFIPSPPGWLDDLEVETAARALDGLLPAHLQGGQLTPLGTIEYLLASIGEVPNFKDREAVLQLAYKLGFSTPTYQVVAEKLFSFSIAAVRIVAQQAFGNPMLINLGASRAPSARLSGNS